MRMSTLRFRMFYLESLKVFHFQCGFWWSTFFPYHVTSLDGAPADFLGMTQNTYLQLYLRTAASLKECTGFVLYWHQSFMVDWLVGFFSCSIRKKKFLFSLVDQVLKRLKKHWLFASLDIHRRSVPCFNWKRSERERPTAPTHASCVWNNWFQKNTILVKNPLWRKVARNVLYSNAAYGDLKPTWQLELSLI